MGLEEGVGHSQGSSRKENRRKGAKGSDSSAGESKGVNNRECGGKSERKNEMKGDVAFLRERED